MIEDRPRRTIRAGIRAVVSMPIVRGVTASESLWSLVLAAMVVAGVVYTPETLDLGDRAESAFALMTTSIAMGAVVGALLASRVERRIGRPLLLLIGYTGPFFMMAGLLQLAHGGHLRRLVSRLNFTDAWAVISFQSYLAESVPGKPPGPGLCRLGRPVSPSLPPLIAYPLLGADRPGPSAPRPPSAWSAWWSDSAAPSCSGSPAQSLSVRTQQAPTS